MTVLATVVVATFLLENDNFIAFYEGTLYLANNFCPFYGGRAYFNGTVGVNEENAVEFYGLALFFLVAEIVYIQELACFGFKLLSLNFYNCVHLNCMIIIKLCRRAGISATYSAARCGQKAHKVTDFPPITQILFALNPPKFLFRKTPSEKFPPNRVGLLNILVCPSESI